ncbi:MAG: HAD hydrolase family protein [Clostridia bacterium]|nr:HAD hydrolase family protein [Clostridia bacterium]
MPHNVDKATSLDEFVLKIGLTREDVICVGDGFNDVSMIRWAGIGVAMANARQPVKEVADRITLSCDEDGVAALIEEIL